MKFSLSESFTHGNPLRGYCRHCLPLKSAEKTSNLPNLFLSSTWIEPLVGEVPKFWILVVQPPLCLTKCHLGPFAHHVLCSGNIVRFLRHQLEFRRHCHRYLDCRASSSLLSCYAPAMVVICLSDMPSTPPPNIPFHNSTNVNPPFLSVPAKWRKSC